MDKLDRKEAKNWVIRNEKGKKSQIISVLESQVAKFELMKWKMQLGSETNRFESFPL